MGTSPTPIGSDSTIDAGLPQTVEFDLARARRETPGCELVTHFNNAAASLMPQPVLDAVIGHLTNESLMGAYEAAAKANVGAVCDSLANLIHAEPSEVALFDNSTRAWNTAFDFLTLRPGDRVVASRSEFVNGSLTLEHAARQLGIEVEIIPCDETGQLSVEALRELMDERVKLIAVTHIPTNGGLVNPVAEVGRVAKDWAVPYLLDASQSLGQYPLNVKEIECDFLSAPGRKYLRGPRGTGLLYVRSEILEQLKVPTPTQDAGTWLEDHRYVPYEGARRFEVGECYVAGRLGLGAAADYALGWGIENIWGRVQFLANRLRSQLTSLPRIQARDLGIVKGGIVSFTHEYLASDEVMRRFSREKINVKVSPGRQSRYDMDARGLDSVVRASVHYYNSESELDRFVELLAAME